jgi:hypothetical protein
MSPAEAEAFAREWLGTEAQVVQCICDEVIPALLAEIDRLRGQRLDAIAQLRSICADFGDNDWDDDLHLGDVIEKHLGKHLYD